MFRECNPFFHHGMGLVKSDPETHSHETAVDPLACLGGEAKPFEQNNSLMLPIILITGAEQILMQSTNTPWIGDEPVLSRAMKLLRLI